MTRVELKHLAVRRPNPFAGWQPKLQALLLLLLILDVLLVCARLKFPKALVGEGAWPDGLLLILAAVSTVTSLTSQVPAQNAILAAVAIACAGAAVHTLCALTSIPFGPIAYDSSRIGRLMFTAVPWPMPLIWVVLVLNSRGVARLLLRPYRPRPNYGLWVMGLTVLLVVLLESSWEPYAILIKQYWSWKATKLHSDWYTVPWSNFLGWAASTALILLFVTPALINKSPVTRPPSLHPLIVWEVLSTLLLTGAILHHLWPAALLTSAQMVGVLILAICSVATRKSRT